MPTTTLTCNKDTRVAYRTSDGWQAGAGTSDYLPVGLYSGYRYRSILGFSGFSASWTSITSATLHIKTSGQYYVAFGSDPDVEVRRITTSWSEGSSSTLSSSNATVYGDYSVDATTATFDVATSENTWDTVNVTTLLQEALAAGVFYGLELRAVDETAASDVTEFYAREYGSNDAYIEVTYVTIVPPDAPTVVTPTAGAFLNDTTPDITYQHNDDDGDATNQYQVQVSTDPAFGTTVFDSGTVVGVVASGANFTVNCTTTLTRGTQYYVRARASDTASGWGSWSSGTAFKVAQTPTCTLTYPSADSQFAKLVYTAGQGWSVPRLYVAWNYACADGGAQSTYEVEVYNSDNLGTLGLSFYDSGEVSSTATTLTISTALTEGNYYLVRARVKCAHGEYSAWNPSAGDGYYHVRARWGMQDHRIDLTTAPNSWNVSTLDTTTTAVSEVVMEYSSDTAANATPTDGWYASLAEATLRRYLYWRVWLLTWGSSPVSPTLNRLTIDYSANVIVPDNWTVNDATDITGDVSTFVYGTQSMRLVGDGTDHIAYQTVTVTPNTDYILSGRIKSSGNSGAKLQIVNAAHTTVLEETTAVTATQDFTRTATAVWNSGANTSCIIRCNASGAAGTYAWFDAIKFEASAVVTPWTPSFLASAVVLDAGGLQIDASNGGVMRLRGSTGGTRDTVELGANGLSFGGDTEVSSPSTGNLKVGTVTGSIVPSGGIIMWSGETSAIPTGWYLCDGTNGTPDLRDRFIIGADSTNENTSGGTVSASAALTHAGTAVSAHAAHSHETPFAISDTVAISSLDQGVFGTGTSRTRDWTASTSDVAGSYAVADSQSVTVGAHTVTQPNDHSIPKFYRLAFIMKA